VIDFAQITPYLVAANFVLTWGVGFYVHLTSKNTAITTRLDTMDDALKGEIKQHAERLVRLEAHHASAPTHADLSNVHDKLNKVTESCSRMEGQLGGMDATQRLILNRITERSAP
jgi:hypothetical protein